MIKPIALVVPLAAVFVAAIHGTSLQQRDPAQQPATRQVPVGTSTITGTLVDSTTGRPVVGARVTVVGQTLAALARSREALAAATARSGGPPVGVPEVRTGLTAGPSPVLGVSTSLTASRVVASDAQGQFVVAHLPAGRYDVNVTHRSYLNGSAGQKKPAGPGVPFMVGDGEKVAVTIPMIRGGVITGTVYGEHGEPLSQTQVQVSRYLFNNGARRLQPMNSVTTDDRGAYRLHGLQPGTYYVSARPIDNGGQTQQYSDTALIEQAVAAGGVRPGAALGLPATVTIPVPQGQGRGGFSGPSAGYLPVFHPGATMVSGASIVRVTGGDEHQNIDINVVLIQASRIEGTITNPPEADQRVQLTLLSHDPSSSSGNGASSTQPDGRFVFGNVAPGQYTIVAQTVPRQPPAPPEAGRSAAAAPVRLWGRAVVTVQGEPSVPVSLALVSGRTISGVVSFEMERRPDLSRSTMTVRLVPAPGETGFQSDTSARIEPDGSFTLIGVPAGRFGFRVTGPWTKSAIVNGQDVLDEPFEFDGSRDVNGVSIVVTDQVPELTGTVTPSQGLIALDYTVVAVPAEERYWTPASRRAMVTRPNADGQYTLRGLPPGAYRVGLVIDFESGSHQDPEFMKVLATTSGEFVTIVNSGKVTQDLRAR